MKVVLVIIFVTAVYAFPSATNKNTTVPLVCEEQEKYNPCGGSCQPSCEDPEAQEKPCSFMCLEICECLPTYLRHASGKCVKKENCKTPQ